MAALRPSSVTRGLISRAAVIALLLAASFVLPATARAGTDAVFTVNGRGWGHGIGLSQYGAKGYATQGRTYDWILAHYFQQTSLATRPELTVKVDLDASKAARSAWRIASASTATTLTVRDLMDGAHAVSVARGSSAWVTFSGGGAVLRADRYDTVAKKHVAGSVIATFPAAVVASTGSSRDSKVRFLGTSGPFSQTNIAWRGQIRFIPNTTTGHAVDYVPMEQYLRGVVPRESPSSWPAQALRAQAVAARSYAYESASSGAVLWCTTMSQVYNGADDGTSSHEAASTDAAIAATPNQYVVYGSKVVKTYFSSSSGGRTANSKDVWFSGSSDDVSPVYYTSVSDADAGNPNYRWPAADFSGAVLATKIRDHDNGSANTDPLDYSAAAPATVTGVTLDPGASGFVRYVTVKWSNGKSYTIKGPTFQSALRLRSSAFTVTLKTPPPPPAPTPKRFEQTDARIGWSGSFVTYPGSALSGGSHKRTAVAGSTVTVAFKGNSLAWVGAKAPTFGRAEVSLDGTRPVTVDLYSSTWSYKRTLWSSGAVSPDTTHTVTIRVLGTRGTAATGSDVSVDAFDILGTLVQAPKPPVTKRIEQTSTAARFAGTWSLKREAALSGGSYRFTRSTAASVSFAFTGTRVKVIGKKGPSFGKMWITLDGGKAVLVDLYSSSVRYRQTLWTSPVLPLAPHSVRVRPAGTRNSRATGAYVGVDAYDVLVPAP